MTTTELLAALARERPNGVSFDPMAVRLLRQKVPFEDWQIEDLKSAMFQLKSGLWFSREMISDDESLSMFGEQAMEWLIEHGCFSIERLFENYCGVLRHITTTEDCAALLRHLGLTTAKLGKRGYFCFQPPPNLEDNLAAISEKITERLEAADGTLTFNTIEQAMPHLTAEALEGIRVHFLPEVHRVEIGGIPCWCRTEAIPLPDDFVKQLTTIVNTLNMLNEKISIEKLEFALNLFYHTRFRKEYALLDNDTFMRVCAEHYQGEDGNDVFPNMKKPRVRANGLSASGRRARNPNTPVRVAEMIGLDGRTISPSTWRLFRIASTSSRVAEWARRAEKGESVENIARKSGLKVSTVTEYIRRRRSYFVICEKNGIVPDGGMNV